MKKTFTINISGSVFHIEDDAYEKLQKYLQDLSHYFGNQKGGQEILQDIEARIAEILQEKMSETWQVVDVGSVDEVIHRMGQPEDFSDTEEVETELPTDKIKKRLYRDGENRVLGGVCSGLSAYFNIDPVFLRILFVVLVFVGVGISVVIYLILWIVVPIAKTTTQRLEMKGEEATISNIQRTIQEEVEEVKKSFSKMNKSESVRKGKEAAGKAGQASVDVAKRLGKVFASLFGALLILIGFAGLIAFIVTLAVGGSVIHGSSVGIHPDVDVAGMLNFVINPGMAGIFILLFILLIGIPFLAILFVGTKLVFRYKTNNKVIGLAGLGIWLLALVAVIVLSAGQISNFSQKNTASIAKPVQCPSNKILYLEPGDVSWKMETQNNLQFDNFILVSVNGENVLAANPRLRIESTDAADFSLIIRKKARGKSLSEVQKNLNNIKFDVISRDTILVFDPWFILSNDGKWRNQEVIVTLKVPVGNKIHLGQGLDQLNFDFENVNNLWNHEMIGKTWEMTPEGLKLHE
ncbi:MAG: PspC domain-containing protein [Prolixibacteraceae bacterium]